MLDNAKNLPDNPAELKGLVVALASELKSQAMLIEKLKHQLSGMRRHRFGSTSEAMDQLEFALEEEEIAASADNGAGADEAAPPKEKPKRKPLPEYLPRNEEVLSPGEACASCGGKLKHLGDDITEELEYIPGRFVVNRIVRPRMNNPKPRHVTVQWLWSQYTDEKRGRAVIETMMYTAKALMPVFGHHDPETITVEQCRKYTASRRAQGRADGTIHTELGHLRTVLCWGAKRRHIAAAPHIERPPKPDPKDRHLTREEARQLLDGATVPHVRLAIILMLGTAARVRAILDLTWDRCDFDRGLIKLKDDDDKTPRKGRAVVPMNDMVRAALNEAREGALSGHVIDWAGKPVLSLKKGLGTAAKKAGLEGFSPHVLRHTSAVWMAEAGIGMDEIAQYLGHRDSRVTTEVYARFSPDYLRGAANVLDLGVVQLNQGALRK